MTASTTLSEVLLDSLGKLLILLLLVDLDLLLPHSWDRGLESSQTSFYIGSMGIGERVLR